MYRSMSLMMRPRDYNHLMRLRWMFLIVLISFLARPALAIDFTKEMAPRRWTERLVPEDLPKLEYPEYYNDLDKARMQMQSGRYRMSLVTLNKVKDADEVEAALVRAGALWHLGRMDEALRVISKA